MSTADYFTNTSSFGYNIAAGYLRPINTNLSAGLEIGGVYMQTRPSQLAFAAVVGEQIISSSLNIQALEFLPELKYTAADNSYFVAKVGIAEVTENFVLSAFDTEDGTTIDIPYDKTELHPAFSVGMGHNYTNHIGTEVDYTYVQGGNMSLKNPLMDFNDSGAGTASISYLSLGLRYSF